MEAAGECHIGPALQRQANVRTHRRRRAATNVPRGTTADCSRTHMCRMIHSRLPQLSTCPHRLNSCRSLEEVGPCTSDICPPNPPFHAVCIGSIHRALRALHFFKSLLLMLPTAAHLSVPNCNCYCEFCPHMQFPDLGFRFPRLVYTTRLGHSSDWNRG